VGKTPKQRVDEIMDQFGGVTIPVDVEAVSKAFNATIAYEVFQDDLSGVLVKATGKAPLIGINARHAKTRQRFTIAHELGHLVMEHQGEIFVDQSVMRRDGKSSQAVDPYEIEANQFAAELLMPQANVVAAFMEKNRESQQGDTAKVIVELAKDFGVSNMAMEFRLKNLGLIMPA
jgi:Zn-dependent peptidase ImmA (M78 family)